MKYKRKTIDREKLVRFIENLRDGMQKELESSVVMRGSLVRIPTEARIREDEFILHAIKDYF